MIRRFRNAVAPKVEFIQHHEPPLDSGVYHVHLKQTLTIGGSAVEAPWERGLTFAVTGERFSSLAPHEIAAVFPTEGSLGDHLNVLPHIMLTRSTLPWERSPDNVNYTLPWLALLLFRDSDFASEADRPVQHTITLGELLSSTEAKFPKLKEEPGQDLHDSVTVVDVKKRLLQAVLPSKSELGLLAHVRQPKNLSGNPLDGPEGLPLATVLCNRLPQPGGTSTAYLVAMEARYESTGDAFDFQGAGENDLIRLVCLKSWRFECTNPEDSFTELLLKANHAPVTLRLPDSGDAGANEYVGMGYVPLPHALRQGDRTVSWYHGPFSPGDVKERLTASARAADELLRYEERTGIFDVSYAAAWELGRMLTLQNQPVALALAQWKRARGLEQRRAKQRVARLPFWAARTEAPQPESVKAWFDDLTILRGVPFEYLVADERLLPPESLRFFRVDVRWVQCLLDGAYSIGSVTEGDRRRAMRRSGDSPVADADRQMTGFLLRSAAVSGWPDMLVDGFSAPVAHSDFQRADDPPKLDLVRMERLSPSVLVCLFDGEVKAVDLFLKPEAIHFGVDMPIDDSPGFKKTLRDRSTGEEVPDRVVDIPWKGGGEERGVIDINRLATEMQSFRRRNSFTSAPFALQMIEGVQKVRFTQQAP